VGSILIAVIELAELSGSGSLDESDSEIGGRL
jgi:hypothetical protein